MKPNPTVLPPSMNRINPDLKADGDKDSTPHKETIASKIRLQNKIVNNLSKYNFESKLPFYKKIYYKVKYYFKSLIDKFYWDFALKKHMPNKSK